VARTRLSRVPTICSPALAPRARRWSGPAT
jgi:hypothetical protein